MSIYRETHTHTHTRPYSVLWRTTVCGGVALRDGVGVDGDGRDADGLLHPVLPVDVHVLEGVEDVHAADDPAEDGVAAVEVRVAAVRDEELTAVRVGPGVGHADDPALVVPQRRPDLVVELAPPDARPALARAQGVARLEDEAFNLLR